ncbi:STAS domain-containing protein [Actinosynnema sp. NPDC059797]
MGETRTEISPAAVTGIHHHDGTVVVEVTGQVDMACSAPIRAIVGEQLDRRPTGLVVDLTGVDFFGSAGVQLLVEAVVQARALGVALAVATDRRAVLHPLRLTRVDEALDVHPTPRDALAALRTGGVPTAPRVACR